MTYFMLILVHFFARFICFFFTLYVDHRDLHSFPTRRSSDLVFHEDLRDEQLLAEGDHRRFREAGWVAAARAKRSEEHTSELQSLRHLVCRLLLEKKKEAEFVIVGAIALQSSGLRCDRHSRIE